MVLAFIFLHSHVSLGDRPPGLQAIIPPPTHVRWEIYPVQHETTARAAYGGSYLEELNWWEK